MKGVQVGGRFANARVQDLLEYAHELPVEFIINAAGVRMLLNGQEQLPPAEASPAPTKKLKRNGRKPGPKPGRRPSPKGPLSIPCAKHKVAAGEPCSKTGAACRVRRKVYRTSNASAPTKASSKPIPHGMKAVAPVRAPAPALVPKAVPHPAAKPKTSRAATAAVNELAKRINGAHPESEVRREVDERCEGCGEDLDELGECTNDECSHCGPESSTLPLKDCNGPRCTVIRAEAELRETEAALAGAVEDEA